MSSDTDQCVLQGVAQTEHTRNTDVAQRGTPGAQKSVHKSIRVSPQLIDRIEALREDGETSTDAWRRVLIVGAETIERGTDVPQAEHARSTPDEGAEVALLREQLEDMRKVRDGLLEKVGDLSSALADMAKVQAVSSVALAAPKKRKGIRAWLESRTGRSES